MSTGGDVYEYGFIADGGPVRDSAFGGLVRFDSAEMARHTGSKWHIETLVIVRRIPAGEWEPVPDGES